MKKSVRELRVLASSLKNKPCIDCIQAGRDGIWPVVAMQYDHVPGRGDKVGNIARLVRSGDEEALLQEIAKCDVVCSNCHAVRSHIRGKSLETRHRMSISQAKKWASTEMKERARANALSVWNDPVRRALRVASMQGVKKR